MVNRIGEAPRATMAQSSPGPRIVRRRWVRSATSLAMSSNSPGSFARWRPWVCIHQLHHNGTESEMMLPSFPLCKKDHGETIAGRPPPRFSAEEACRTLLRQGRRGYRPREAQGSLQAVAKQGSAAVSEPDARRESPRAGECRWALSCGPTGSRRRPRSSSAPGTARFCPR